VCEASRPWVGSSKTRRKVKRRARKNRKMTREEGKTYGGAAHVRGDRDPAQCNRHPQKAGEERTYESKKSG